MRTLAELMLISVLVVLGVSAIAAVLIRRAVRRLRRNPFVRVAHEAGQRLRSYAAYRPVGDGRSPRRLAPPGYGGEVVAASVLLARSWLPGPAADVTRVRLALQRDVTATWRSVRAARSAGRPVHEFERRMTTLAAHAEALQVDLQIIAAEPDSSAKARLLVAPLERADLIRHGCAQIRAGLLEHGSAATEPALHRLVDDINEAATGARLRASAFEELSRR
jgi:hypothetical protein